MIKYTELIKNIIYKIRNLNKNENNTFILKYLKRTKKKAGKLK